MKRRFRFVLSSVLLAGLFLSAQAVFAHGSAEKSNAAASSTSKVYTIAFVPKLVGPIGKGGSGWMSV